MIGKWILKTWIIINNFGQLHTQELKSTKKQVLRLQLNEKTWKESQTWLMSLYWKRKPIWRKDLITYNSYPWIMFSSKWLVIIWRGGFVCNWTSKSRGWNNFGRGWTRVVGGSWKLDNFHGRHMCIIPKSEFFNELMKYEELLHLALLKSTLQ